MFFSKVLSLRLGLSDMPVVSEQAVSVDEA